MSLSRHFRHLSVVVFTLCFFLSACAAPTANPTSQGNNGTTKTDTNQAATAQPQSGDIPDTQAFVTYHSTQDGYSVEVPEGWSQMTLPNGVRFVNQFNSVQIQLSQAQSAPTVASSRAADATTLQQSGDTVKDIKVQSTQLVDGPAVLLTYSSNSAANSVTGKQTRLENNRYLLFHNGKLATLTLSAPIGADNVDQWARISRSFRWS
jgi:hypothetical protein